MKRRFMTLLVAAAGIFALTAVAQTPENNGTQCKTKTECTTKKNKKDCKGLNCKKNDRKGRPGKDGRCKGQKCDSISPAMKREAAMFNGINLTESQKTAIANLNRQRAEARDASRAEMLKNKDNKTAPEARPSRREMEQQRMNARLDYLKQMQAILTPDQYVTFLENTAVNAPRYVGAQRGPGKNVKAGDRRGGKKDMRPDRPRDGKKDMQRPDSQRR